MKFYIMNDGDSSVGLSGFSIEIEITDKDEILEHDKHEFILRLKEFMKKELEGEDGRTEILTQEEIDQYLYQQEEF